jgi:hypothetical protein
MMSGKVHVEQSLDDLAGTASRVGWSVRGLSKWANNTRCGTAAAAFAGRVDLDRLMSGTGFEVEYGQSPFMIMRGKLVESKVRENGYAELLPILREALSFDMTEVTALNLKRGYPPNTKGFEQRATATRHALSAILRGTPDAPNILEGAVLAAQLGPYTARFEADAIGARFGPVLHGLEVKSWPVVDGRADDPGKASEALRQLGFYLLLLRLTIEDLRSDPEVVSPTGLLVTPKNVGLTLVGSVRHLEREIKVAETTLARLPDSSDYVGVGPQEGFGPAGEAAGLGREERLDHLDGLTDRFGVHYQASCLSSCGMAKFCREKLHSAGDPSVCGVATVRFLPGVRSLDRAAELGAGAPPTTAETKTGVAEILSEAHSLYRSKAASSPRPRKGAA